MQVPSLAYITLMWAAGPCLAQEAEPVEARVPPTAPAPVPAVDAEALAQDLEQLGVLALLAPDDTQLAKIVPVVAEVAEARQTAQDADDAAYAENAAPIDRVTAALLAAQQPSEEDAGAYNSLTAQAQQRRDELAALAGQAAVRIQRVLTARQAARIETAAQQRQRLALLRRLGGSDTVVDYIVKQLKGQVQLMPDEYLRMREQRALEMARAIAGNAGPGTTTLAQQLLAIMNWVASLTPEQFQQELPTLGSRIAKQLNLPDPTAGDIIRYEDFLAWIQNPRTPELLEQALALRTALEEVGRRAQPELAAAPAPQEGALAKLTRETNYVVALNQLGIANDQLAQLLPLSSQLVQLIAQSDQSKVAPITNATPLFMQVRQKLIAGEKLSDEEQTALGNLKANVQGVQEELYEQADLLLQSIRKVLLPQQNAYIDWTNPHEVTVSAESAVEGAVRERDRAAMMMMTMEFLEKLRNMTQDQWLILRVARVRDFLRPLFGAGTPEAMRAEQFVMQLTNEVKQLDEFTWEQRGQQYAAMLLDRLGLVSETPPEPRKPYDWEDMLRLFGDEETPRLLPRMIQARGGAGQAPY